MGPLMFSDRTCWNREQNRLSRTLAELDMDTAQIRNGMRRPPVSERPRVQTITQGMGRGFTGAR